MQLPQTNEVRYGARIHDDPDHPLTGWSLVEQEEELTAISMVLRLESCSVHLFNEASVNVYSTVVTFRLTPPGAHNPSEGARLSEEGSWRQRRAQIGRLLDRVHGGTPVDTPSVVAVPAPDFTWAETTSTYVTNQLSPGGIL
jgi:hypothetical protein